MDNRLCVRLTKSLHTLIKATAIINKKTMNSIIIHLLYCSTSDNAAMSLVQIKTTLLQQDNKYNNGLIRQNINVRCSSELLELLDKRQFTHSSRNAEISFILQAFFNPDFPIWTLRHSQFLKKIRQSGTEKIEITVLKGEDDKKLLFKKEMKQLGAKVDEALFGQGDDVYQINSNLLETALAYASRLQLEVYASTQ